MVAAVLSSLKSFRKMTELCVQDRSWLVAGLTAAGMTAQDIADRTGCSLRLVRAIRAQDMTQAFVVAQRETREVSDELRLERIELAAIRHDANRSKAEAVRLRTQLIQVVNSRSGVEVFGCGHPMTAENVYRNDGKRYCRECRRVRQARHRKARAATL